MVPGGWGVEQTNNVMRGITQDVAKVRQIVLFLFEGWRISSNKATHETVSLNDVLFLLLMKLGAVACEPSIKVMAIV